MSLGFAEMSMQNELGFTKKTCRLNTAEEACYISVAIAVKLEVLLESGRPRLEMQLAQLGS